MGPLCIFTILIEKGSEGWRTLGLIPLLHAMPHNICSMRRLDSGQLIEYVRSYPQGQWPCTCL